VEAAERWMQNAFATFKKASGQQRALYVGIIASALALLIVVTVKIAHKPDALAPQVAMEAQTTPAAALPSTGGVAVAPAVKKTAPEAVAASPKMAEPVPSKQPKAARPADAAVAQDSKQLSGSPTSMKESAEAKPVAMATVGIAVAPWGEVYLDGKKQGVSPPLDALHVTPGEHAIEFRNTTFPPYTLSIQVKAGEQMKIRHKFAN